MSEIAPTKCRVEIIRGPSKFFDDNFQKGWSALQGSIDIGDGELLKVKSDASNPGNASKSLPSISTDAFARIILRVHSVVGGTTWGVYVYAGATPFNIWTGQSGAGLFQAALPAGQTLTEIRMISEGFGVGKEVHFDYVCICGYDVLIPVDTGDVVEELTITRPILNQGIAGAKLTLPNFGGALNGVINKHDIIIIWQSRTGTIAPEYKAFGGRIVKPTNEGRGQGAFFITLDCHSHAWELINPPALLQKLYFATNGRTIIEDALALCSYVAKHPYPAKWFDNTGSSGSTDDRINSTHDCEYDEEIPMTVIKEILEKASNPAGVKGFDMYETPSGCLIGHLRNSLDFTSPIASITPESYARSEDTYRVKNKNIKVYGKAEKKIPGADEWCESLTGWTSDQPLSLDSTQVFIGSYSIKSSGTPVTYMQKTFSAISIKFPKESKKLRFAVYFEGPNVSEIQIKLLCPNNLNHYRKSISGIFEPNQWHEIEVDLPPSGDWMSLGSPNLANVQGVYCYYFSTGITSARIDNLHFYGQRFSGSAEDTTSQQNYGERVPEPVVDDALKSDAECLAYSQSLRDFLKDPVITLDDILVDGDYRYNPGDRQRIIVSNDNLDAYFRIIQLRHKVTDVTWDTTLTLSNEPQHIDYVFRIIEEFQKRLERRY